MTNDFSPATMTVHISIGLDTQLQSLLERLVTPPNITARLDSIDSKLATIVEKENQIIMALADFQTKIDQINANTTASAAAAQATAAALAALKQQITSMGLSAEQEATLLNALDQPIATTAALKTFLEQTAASATEPTPVPVPAPTV